MEGGDEAAADEADAQHREFRELRHISFPPSMTPVVAQRVR